MLIAKVAISLLWIGAIIDPVGSMYGIRYVALIIAATALVWMFSIDPHHKLDRSYRGILIVFLVGLLPLHGLLLYSLNAGSQEFIDTSYLAAGALMLTSLLYYDSTMINFGIRCLLLSTRLLSALVFAAFAAQFLSLDSWLSHLTERNVALISFREYSGIRLPYIYFLASPLLILLISHDFEKLRRHPCIYNFLVFLLTSFSFALTGTRAHILLALFFAPIYLLITSRSKTVFQAIGFSIIVLIPILALDSTKILFAAFTSTSETSNSMKIALLDGYMELFSNPVTLVFGQGFNAHEWSPPLREMIAMDVGASKTELTYLELIRVFGIVVASAFITTLILLLRSTKRLHFGLHWVFPGFSIYLVNAAINPYLFSVNGILPLGLIAACTLHVQEKSRRPSTPQNRTYQ